MTTHVSKELPIRNPKRPTLERLPVPLTEPEQLATMRRTDALDRTIDERRAQIEAIKARAKEEANKLYEEIVELEAERRELRDQRLSGAEVRSVPCELLEDVEEGKLYVFRLDLREVAQVRDMEPSELAELKKQPQLELRDRPTRRVDIPSSVEEVRRFDSDPPGLGDDDQDEPKPDAEDAKGGSNGSAYAHEHEYDDGSCITCGQPDSEAEAEAEPTKPVRRKRGEKQEGTGSAKKKGKGRGYDTRAAETH